MAPIDSQWSKCSATSRYSLFSKDGKNFTGLEGVNNFHEANNIFSHFDENCYNPYNPDSKDRDKLFKPPGTLADAVNRLFSKKYTDSWETFTSTKWWKESCQNFKLDLEAHIQKIYPRAQKYYEALFKDDKVPNKKFFGPRNTDNKTWNGYLINVIYDRYALNGSSYSIQFWFGGDGRDRDTTFRDSENLIGQVYSFAGLEPTVESCSNCASQKDEKVLSRARILLTIPIISQALDQRFQHIDSTTTDQVEHYLAKYLHWKFVRIGGKVRPATDFPKTIISELKGTGKPQETDKALLPVYTEHRPLYKPTEQKDCGVKKGKGLLGAPERLSFRTFED
ncbi:Tyrosinase [Fusarium oxysporum f. sp. raphani]|uniref:Tyrosinase n=1 Tax=Fusarium oxysporum f. sp. raphani TaxID=96318 RepID=A0A8J5QI62_FUSOX|nr:Tyrosinase [Fusarium oxysporum f. sp. raphani]